MATPAKSDLDDFRTEVRDWLESAVPQGVRGLQLSTDQICWGGKKWMFDPPETRDWLEAASARGFLRGEPQDGQRLSNRARSEEMSRLFLRRVGTDLGASEAQRAGATRCVGVVREGRGQVEVSELYFSTHTPEEARVQEVVPNRVGSGPASPTRGSRPVLRGYARPQHARELGRDGVLDAPASQEPLDPTAHAHQVT